MSKFLRGLRNKIQESLKKGGGGRNKFEDSLTETPSGRFNKVVRGGKKGFEAVVGFLKIKF